MKLGTLIEYMNFRTYVIIRCNEEIIFQGVSIDIADNMIDAGMWNCYDVIDFELHDNKLIINVAEGEY